MPSDPSRFQVREEGATCLVLKCEGGLTRGDRELLAAQVESYMEPRPAIKCVVLDLGAVRFVNSAGLGALFQLNAKVRSRDGRLIFADVPPLVARMLDTAGIDRLATIEPDVRTALESLGIEAGTEPTDASPAGTPAAAGDSA